MFITDTKKQKKVDVAIFPIEKWDYDQISAKSYFFSWTEEVDFNVYKLVIIGSEDVLGLVSLDFIDSESRIEIRLLAVSVENQGTAKKYNRIAGCLIGYACRTALIRYVNAPCISLEPKTELREHYKNYYNMKDGGRSVFSDGLNLIKLSIEYE
jgi:hypothetical protein